MKAKEMKMVSKVITHEETKAGSQTEITEKKGYLPGEPFHFSEKEKEKILNMIRDYKLVWTDTERWLFLTLEYHCTRFIWMQGAPNREDHRDKLNDAKKSFEKTIKHLEILKDDYLPWINLRTPDPYMKNYFSDAENQAVILDKLNIAKEQLNFLIKEIQKYEEPKRKNWKDPHNITTQFFIEVAKILDMQFSNVDLTKKETGFFRQFCEILLTILNPDKEYKDIKRSYEKAIDALEEEKKKPLYWIE